MVDIVKLKKDIEEITGLRVKPTNGKYDELGQKILEWATNSESRPDLNADGTVQDAAAFRAEIEGFFDNLPEGITKFTFVQPEPGEYFIRLPPALNAEKSRSVMERMTNLTEAEREQVDFTYPMPAFYTTRVLSDGDDPADLEFLESRVGDYTFAHCA